MLLTSAVVMLVWDQMLDCPMPTSVIVCLTFWKPASQVPTLLSNIQTLYITRQHSCVEKLLSLVCCGLQIMQELLPSVALFLQGGHPDAHQSLAAGLIGDTLNRVIAEGDRTMYCSGLQVLVRDCLSPR